MRARPLAESFWEKVDKRGPDECWPWTRGINDGGYGHTHTRHVNEQLAHRIAWFLTNGPIPKGLFVLHSCDNPPCCNPAHLRAGTRQDNVDDMMRRQRSSAQKRTHCVNGHEFIPENVYLRRRPAKPWTLRQCRACVLIRSAARRQAHREMKGMAHV